MTKLPIAVLASGKGSNFLAIIKGIAKGKIAAEVKVLITDNPSAGAIKIAGKSGIPAEIVEKTKFQNRDDLDMRIKEILDARKVELVVLAGYMLLIKSPTLLNAYKNRVINIHPALLPSFPGVDAQKQAFDFGAKVSGITIHFVDESLDEGPIIFQKAVDISDCKSESEVRKRLLKLEHKFYKAVVNSFAHGKYEVHGKRVTYEKHRH